MEATTTYPTLPCVYSDGNGQMELVTTAEAYVRCALHDKTSVETRLNQYGDWAIWSTAHSGQQSRESGLCNSEDEAWANAADLMEKSGFTGSDNASFETEGSIREYIGELDPNDHEDREIIGTQQEMLKMLGAE